MRRLSGWVFMFALLGLLSGCSRTSKTGTEASPANSRHTQVAANQAPEKTAPPSANAGTGVFINGRELSPDQAMALAATYHYAPPRGHFWYDAVSGAWGVEGHEAVGFILPGYDFGPLASDASAGNTGVFINGREINMIEAASLQRTFGAVYQGHWWLDGRTGNYGIEGNPVPMGNIIAALRAQNSARNGDNFWSSSTARGNSSGGCSYVSVDGATATSGCD